MRLQRYISESRMSTEKIIDILQDKCAPFMKELAKQDYKYFLYRGYKGITGDINFITSHKNRIPRDTPERLHKLLDELFQKKFGWGVRSEGVFAAPQFYDHGQYGRVSMFFPVDKFKYVWSPAIPDLYEEWDIMTLCYFSDNRSDRMEYYLQQHNEYCAENDYMDYDEWFEEYKDEIDKDMRSVIEYMVNKYTDKGLERALRGGHNEMSFKCDEYVLVDKSSQELRRYL